MLISEIKNKEVREPALVAWVLFDATADQKYIKMNDRDGSLAFFDSEAAAQRAKHMAPGTDYKRCEYYTTPQPAEQQPAPDVSALVEALEKGFPLLSDEGLDEVEHHCEWVIQRERKRVHSILAAYRKGGDQA